MGGGLVAAIDEMRFVVPIRTVDARPNPKYPDVVSGIVTLLGFDHRVLADLPDAKLWCTDPTATYGTPDKTAHGRIDPDKIRRHWPSY